ncbi:cleavage and polyadenylation specificity factor subunit 3 [Pancytospora philotis]|nr:cleavage and polyadenylation specificity factor subunit 3 [Pancytospora philotis]
MAEEDRVVITPLGAGNEVGRSCIHVKYRNKQLLLDCGVHPAYAGISALPFLDLVDLSKINAILVTHFHLDHAAALPFLTEKTAFRGAVYMTHPTKAILKWLLNDYIRVINSSSDQDFYSEADLESCYSKIIAIDYHQQISIDGINFTALNAGHVLGAAMFLVEIEKSKFLYTGDFSREEDRHLKAAESPGCRLDALITESTYGVQCHLSRNERESRFTSVVSDIVSRGGRCLLPVFALGRAQELLLILEEHWAAHAALQKVPIYYVSTLARRCMSVYQTYINMMNERIQRISLKKNPFDFEYVKSLKDIQSFNDDGPCVMMASPGMLQSGLSRELFEKWCSNARNGVVVPGYCVEGTMAKEILSEPKEVESMRGGMLRLNMTVEYISFSAHADYTQNSQFIDECAPANLFFVHGEMNEMMRLKNAISVRNEKRGIEMALFALRNGEEGSFVVAKDNDAKVYTNKAAFDSIVVIDDAVRLFDKDDLAECEFEQVKLTQRQLIPFNSTYTLIRQILITEYEATEVEADSADPQTGGGRCLKIGGITVSCRGAEIAMEWESSYLDDVVALSICKSIKDVGHSVKSIRLSKLDYEATLLDTLRCYYPDVVCDGGKIAVRWKDKSAEIENGAVTGNDTAMVGKITALIDKVKLIFAD